ncbi:MAG: hypothetical protein MZV65_33125 [Chromatiales bacterium]|nr:hypothetical protein [Chromatiales bacterium]
MHDAAGRPRLRAPGSRPPRMPVAGGAGGRAALRGHEFHHSEPRRTSTRALRYAYTRAARPRRRRRARRHRASHNLLASYAHLRSVARQRLGRRASSPLPAAARGEARPGSRRSAA